MFRPKKEDCFEGDFPIALKPSTAHKDRIACISEDLVLFEICRYTGVIFKKPIPIGHPIRTQINTIRGYNGKEFLEIN